MTIAIAFPDFPVATLPANLAELGFEDISWRNDACPAFRNKALGVVVFVDFPDASVREFPNGSRFNVYRADPCGSIAQDFASVESDDWADVERFVAQLRVEADARRDASALVEALNTFGSSLAQWAEVRLDDGSTVEEVRGELVEAMRVVDIERLADRFVELVERDLAPHLDEIRRRNVDAPEGVCATHDFCDANEIMAEAFEAVIGREPDVSTEADCALWSAAWAAAMPRLTDAKPADA